MKPRDNEDGVQFDHAKAERLLSWLKRRHKDPKTAIETMAIAIAGLLCTIGNSEQDTQEGVDAVRALLADIVHDMWNGKTEH